MLNVMGVVRDFHTTLSRYTDFVIRDISQKYNLDYKEMADKYIVKCSRSIRSKATAAANARVMPLMHTKSVQGDDELTAK